MSEIMACWLLAFLSTYCLEYSSGKIASILSAVAAIALWTFTLCATIIKVTYC